LSLSFLKQKRIKILFTILISILITILLLTVLFAIAREIWGDEKPQIDFSAETFDYPLEKIDSDCDSEYMFVLWSDYHKSYLLCDNSEFIKTNKMDLVFGRIPDPTVEGDLVGSCGSITIFQDGIEWDQHDELIVTNWPFTIVYLNSFESVIQYLTRDELIEYYEENGLKPHFAFLWGAY